MSCFIISNNHMNHVVDALRYVNWPEDFKGLDNPKACQALGERLFDLNRQAYAQRYREDAEKIADGRDWKYRPTLRDRIGCYKALVSFIYQSSEGNVPDADLFKAVQMARSELADMIIRRLPQYEAANVSF